MLFYPSLGTRDPTVQDIQAIVLSFTQGNFPFDFSLLDPDNVNIYNSATRNCTLVTFVPKPGVRLSRHYFFPRDFIRGSTVLRILYYDVQIQRYKKEVAPSTVKAYLPVNAPEVITSDIQTHILDLVLSGRVTLKSAFQFHRSQQLLRQEIHMRTFQPRTVTSIWLWGDSGVGKTARVSAQFPEAYVKYSFDHFFDGYTGQDVIVFHEVPLYLFRGESNKALVEEIKNWTDPHNQTRLLPVKSSSVPAKHTLFIFTSNASLDDCIASLPPASQEALRRRITTIHITLEDQVYATRSDVTRRFIAFPTLKSILAK